MNTYAGVLFAKGKWRVSISINRKRKSLGSFDKFEDAVNARKKAEVENYYYTGDFSKREITQENLKALLHYNPETGRFTWVVNYGGHIEYGKEAGGIDVDTRPGGKTYLRVTLYKQMFFMHRLAFLYMTGEFPKNVVDHIDGNGINNKWSNLRDVTIAENNRNNKKRIDNTSDVTGVSWNKKNENWNVNINHEGQQIHLGTFDSKQEAIAARKSAEKILNYHNNHGTKRAL